MEAIKQIVMDLDIPRKKQLYIQNKELIYSIVRSMQVLLLNDDVRQYAKNMALLETDIDDDLRKKYMLYNYVLLKKNQSVEAYASLKRDYDKVEGKAETYFRSINVDLRKALMDLKLPEIYVYQGMLGMDNLKICRHLIVPGTYLTIEQDSEVDAVIYPKHFEESKNKINHFYNDVSFRYLADLSKDYSFDLDGKSLGKVRIK